MNNQEVQPTATTTPSYTISRYKSFTTKDNDEPEPTHLDMKSLPPLLQRLLPFSAGKNPKLFIALCHPWDMFGLLFFVALTDSLVIGTIITVVGHVNSCSGAALCIHKGPLYDMLGDPKVAQRARKLANGFSFLMGFFFFVMFPLIYYVLFIPMLETDIFGTNEITKYIVIGTMISTPIMQVLCTPMMLLAQPLRDEAFESWQQKIEEYVIFLRMELLSDIEGNNACNVTNSDTNTDTDTNTDRIQNMSARAVLGRIGGKQQVANKWAMSINYATGFFNNLNITTSIIMPFAILGGMSVSTKTLEPGRFAILLVMIFIMSYFAFRGLSAVTAPNTKWQKCCRELLTDARLKPRIHQIFGTHPEAWKQFLNDHELSAARLFGVRVTNKKLSEVSGLIGSVLTLILYFVVRQEINKMSLS